MSSVKVLVWKTSEASGEPEVEVKIPATLAKWIPRMMTFVPKKTKDEVWGEQVDFNAMFANIEELIDEAAKNGSKEITDVKTRESHVKVLVEA
jgi:hypothetical protein